VPSLSAHWYQLGCASQQRRLHEARQSFAILTALTSASTIWMRAATAPFCAHIGDELPYLRVFCRPFDSVVPVCLRCGRGRSEPKTDWILLLVKLKMMLPPVHCRPISYQGRLGVICYFYALPLLPALTFSPLIETCVCRRRAPYGANGIRREPMEITVELVEDALTNCELQPHGRAPAARRGAARESVPG
jgi:hypothetical protein